MPRIPKRAARQRREATSADKWFLRSGVQFSGENNWDGAEVAETLDDVPEELRDDLIAMWESCREELLAFDRYVGSRPFAWWLCESRQPRDREIPERVQLERMGALTPEELRRLEERDRRIAKARSNFDPDD
jgi:hypothetical protein